MYYSYKLNWIFFCFFLLNSVFVFCNLPKYCSEDSKHVECTFSKGGDVQALAESIDKNTLKLTIKGNFVDFGTQFRLPSLNHLSLEGVKLKEVPKNLSVMFPKLTLLYLSKNEIPKLQPNDFLGLQNLVKLELNSNKLMKLEDDIFRPLGNLLQLLINENQIEHISKNAFRGLKSLRNLKIEKNKLQELNPGIFDYFVGSNALKLQFPFNSITRIPSGLFTKLKKFQEFNLLNNNITSIAPDAFYNTTIKTVILDENNLTTTPATLFKNSQMKLLLLRNNNVQCDSRMIDFFMLSNIETVYGNCKGPAEYKGTPLENFRGKSRQEITISLSTVCELNNTCANKATCVPINRTKISCNCNKEYTGKLCETFLFCSQSPCKNDGVCQEVGGNSYKCHCKHGYIGKRCTTNSKHIIVGVVVTLAILALVGIIIFLKLRSSRSKPSNPGEEKRLNEEQAKESS